MVEESDILGEKIHRNYQMLMMVIFYGRRDIPLPICYPYLIDENGEKISLREGVNKVLETLSGIPCYPRKSRKIKWTKENLIQLLMLRFGLKDGKSNALEEVGRKFNGLSRERIQQVEVGILRMLRYPSRSKILKKFLIPTPEERSKDLQRLKELKDTIEMIGTTNQELEEENIILRGENLRLRFCG